MVRHSKEEVNLQLVVTSASFRITRPRGLNYHLILHTGPSLFLAYNVYLKNWVGPGDKATCIDCRLYY